MGGGEAGTGEKGCPEDGSGCEAGVVAVSEHAGQIQEEGE